MTSASARSASPPTPVRTPTTRPAPAVRPMAMSAGESPTTAVRAGSTPTARHTCRTGSGAGLLAMPSSAHTTASMRSPRPSASIVRSVGWRSSLVATAMRRPPARSRQSSPRRSVERVGQRRRVGRVPGAGHRLVGAVPGATPGVDQHGDGHVVEPGHGRRDEAAARAGHPGHRVVAEHRVQRLAHGRAGGRHEAIGEGLRPAAPHRVEVDERAVLVEDDEVDARRDPRPGGRRRYRHGLGQSIASAAASRSSASAGASEPRTRQASGGKVMRHRRADGGHGQVRVVERVDIDGRGVVAVADPHAEAHHRAQEGDIGDGRRARRCARAPDPGSTPSTRRIISGRRATPTVEPDAPVRVEVVRISRPPMASRPLRGVDDAGGDGVERAHERGHERGGREVVDLEGRADLLDPALAHDHDPVGQLEGLLLVVGHVHGGDAQLALDLADLVAQGDADLGVERGQRLVEQEHGRLDGQGPGQGHALLLAAGQLVRVAGAAVLEVDELEQLVDALADLVAGRARGS